MSQVSNRPDLMNLSFSGCGFLCVYHTGVAAAIKEYAPHLTQNRISGASAGSIIAAALLNGICISQTTSTILKVVTQANKRTLGPVNPQFNLLEIVREEVEKTLPPDAYKTCTNRLFISLTRWADRENVIVSEYCSNEDLVDAIMCSCFIPFYCGFSRPKYRGVEYMDGGLSNNQPVYDRHTVTVSPFSGESDICPPDWDSASMFGLYFHRTSVRLTTRNMFRLMACFLPRNAEDCAKMCLQGFEDALRFLTKNGLAPCIRCLTILTNTEGAVCPRSDAELNGSGNAPGPSKKPRKRTPSQRTNYDSDMETCCESEHVYNTGVHSVVPPLLMKPFTEAIAAEQSMFAYLFSFRIMKLARTAFGLSVLPIDVAVLLAKNILTWLSAVAAPPWLVHKFQQLSHFILNEIGTQQSRYTKFSCHMSVMEFDSAQLQKYDEKDFEMIEMSDDAKRELEIIKEVERKKKGGVDLQCKDSAAKRKLSKHSSFDDASARKSDSPSGSKTPSTSSAVAKDWTYMARKGNFQKRLILFYFQDDVDSLQHVIKYSQQHDAMYEFHYYDENNKLKSFELFNMADPTKRHTCHSSIDSPRCVSTVLEECEQPEPLGCSMRRMGAPFHLSTQSLPVPLQQHSLRSIPASPEPLVDSVERTSTSPPDVDEVDSGLSGMDAHPRTSISSNSSHKWDRQSTSNAYGRRDACCSPVRHLSSTNSNSVRSLNSGATSSASTSGTLVSSGSRKSHVQRRHTMATSLPFNRKHSILQPTSSVKQQQQPRGLPSLISSDSEADGGEKLFVPSRRFRRTSNDYDAGQEESDEEEEEEKQEIQTQRSCKHSKEETNV
ncbi:hypothetical protein WR25_19538 [Diploscapter pachys]|uniref:PNPLA domain-containing protein n=1 Tax=Diploscapter pachys TaxID=2018661 RepID=A0A2A2JEX1_9BILA|nr:hypothetical protein WR25_19538 [Diploscapter pachys]